jgi:protein-S-isoprenylcysteine O-methyltransferase Ste14
VSEIHGVSAAVVVFAALGRSIGIFAVKFRQLAYRKHAVVYPSNWRDRIASPEPFLLFALTLGLLATHAWPTAPGAGDVTSVLGALSAAGGIGLMLWAVRSFPTVSSGHYILPEHRIVTRGPYGWVRHPLYVAALLIWLGLVLAFRSLAALAIAVTYVLPAYWVYMRSEERMMREHFGQGYGRYMAEVGMVVPKLGPHRRARRR